MSRFAIDSRPASARHIVEFYREEFVKHRRCLQEQRLYYSERAITDVEVALAGTIKRLEYLSSQDDAPRLVSLLLKKFDIVTRLSTWSDPKQTH